MNLVTFHVLSAYGFDHAERVADELSIPRDKKRGVLFKMVGDTKRIFDRGGHNYYYWRSDKTKATWYPPGRGYEPPPPEPEWEAEEELPPIPLPPPPTPKQSEMFVEATFKSVWRAEPKTKRRL